MIQFTQTGHFKYQNKMYFQNGFRIQNITQQFLLGTTTWDYGKLTSVIAISTLLHSTIRYKVLQLLVIIFHSTSRWIKVTVHSRKYIDNVVCPLEIETDVNISICIYFIYNGRVHWKAISLTLLDFFSWKLLKINRS